MKQQLPRSTSKVIVEFADTEGLSIGEATNLFNVSQQEAVRHLQQGEGGGEGGDGLTPQDQLDMNWNLNVAEGLPGSNTPDKDFEGFLESQSPDAEMLKTLRGLNVSNVGEKKG